mgnify:CR=1 FL=1
MTVDRHQVTVFQYLSRVADAIDTGYAEFSRNDRAVDQHPAPAFDNRTRQWNQMCHGRLDGVTDQDFPLPEPAEVMPPVNTAHRAGGSTG